MSDSQTTIRYKDSNGEKYGYIVEVDHEQNRYLVIPFHSSNRTWVSKEDAVIVDHEELNNDFIQRSLLSAINQPEINKDDLNISFNRLSLCSTTKQPEKMEKDLDDAEIEYTSNDPYWEVGKICICRWHYDNQWYFSVITAVFPAERTVDVRFLYYENLQMSIPFDRIHPVNSFTMQWVKDEDNGNAASRFFGGKYGCFDDKNDYLPYVGDYCICLLPDSDFYVYVEVVAINFREKTYDVVIPPNKSFTYHVPLENLFPFDSPKAKLVIDEENIAAANAEIARILYVRQFVRQPAEENSQDEEEIEQASTTPEEMNDQNKNGKRRESLQHGPDEKLKIPELSRFWLSIVKKYYGSGTSAIRSLILNQYKLGYDAGFKMGLETRRAMHE